MAPQRQPRPSRAQKSCFLRKNSGSWKRSAATMALAEYTITTPIDTSATTTPKSQRSGVSLRGINQDWGGATAAPPPDPSTGSDSSAEPQHGGLEDVAAVLEVLEHVEGRARR